MSRGLDEEAISASFEVDANRMTESGRFASPHSSLEYKCDVEREAGFPEELGSRPLRQ